MDRFKTKYNESFFTIEQLKPYLSVGKTIEEKLYSKFRLAELLGKKIKVKNLKDKISTSWMLTSQHLRFSEKIVTISYADPSGFFLIEEGKQEEDEYLLFLWEWIV